MIGVGCPKLGGLLGVDSEIGIEVVLLYALTIAFRLFAFESDKSL
jgi:hypothetical protein